MRTRVAGGVVGVVFGVTLSWTGLTSPDVLREGLLLDNAYLYLVFASAVATSGVGWAVADACPGPIATQVGQGVLWSLFTITGVVIGMVLFLRVGDSARQ